MSAQSGNQFYNKKNTNGMKSEHLDQGTAAENCAESGLFRALLCTGLCGMGGKGRGTGFLFWCT